MNHCRVRFLCLPDIQRPIGGVKQLYRHSEHLTSLGYDSAVVTESDNFRPSWFNSSAKTTSFSQCLASGEIPSPHTILVVPETYIGVDFLSFRDVDISLCPRVIFNQNAYYTYDGIGDSGFDLLTSFYDSPNVLQVLSVSEDTHRFLSFNLSISDSRLSRIINAIEPMFSMGTTKKKLMHWMPRKNPQHVQAILYGLKKANLPYLDGWRGLPLDNLPHSDIADSLKSASIFLSFGHPEGFGLPVLEALASGCWVVGYTGGGADELFKLGPSESVRYGDWSSYLSGINSALQSFHTQPRETLLKLQRQSIAAKSLYSKELEKTSISVAWTRVFESHNAWLKSH